MASILIVEDEQAMQDIIADYMRKGGHRCFTAGDGLDALVMLKEHPMDLLILDVMMPHLDDKLNGYGCGADDYMTKPFSPRVLLAKVNALLRRASKLSAGAVNAGKIMLRPNARKVDLDGQEVVLTHKEYELLSFLMANPGQIFSREQLLNRIWGYDFAGTTRTVDTHIKTLRQKLGDEGRHIVTLIRSGYKFEVTP